MFRVLTASLAGVVALAAASAAQSAILIYQTNLSGPNESPPVASAGTGTAVLTIDTVTHELNVQVNFTGLTGLTTISHVHCCTAVPLTSTVGVSTALPSFPNFPTGVTSGSYYRTFSMLDPATFNPGFITLGGGTVAGAEALFIQGLNEQRAYLNVHSNFSASGEIRGFLALAPVPEPSTWAMLILGFGAIGAMLRRRRTPALA